MKIKIAFIVAATYRAFPLERDTAHIPVYAVVAQTERARQLFAPKQIREPAEFFIIPFINRIPTTSNPFDIQPNFSAHIITRFLVFQ